jgi:hypothetical protein
VGATVTVDFKVEVRGLEEVQKAMEQIVRDLSGPPMVEAMRTATLLVERQAKIFSPVDTGRLRASITPQVVSGLGIGGVRGIVGTNVSYAPYVELRPARHKVGRMHYMRDAFMENKERIFRTISAAVQKIVRGKK